jgi:predicted enzyme related to lactoylglutathione lyase
MPHIDTHKPGSFCWVELGTTDQPAAQKFYAALFGWSVLEVPGGAGSYYLYQLEGRDAAAGYTLRPDQQGMPPHWMLYIAAADVDASAKRVPELGGKVHMGPFDAGEFGRLAVSSDPTGAMFTMWQGNKTAGTGITGVHGTLCWADLSTPDVPTAKAFYEALFGWKIFAAPTDPSGYLHIQNGDKDTDMIGGIPPSAHRPPNAPPHWLVYFYVKDCDVSAAAATAAGGKILMGPMTIEKVGRLAVIADPQGAGFAIFKDIPH